MKKLNLLIGLFFAILFISCSSDDNNETQSPSISGEIIVNGQSFDLTEGYIISNYTGSDPNYDPRRFYFALTNGEVSLNNNEFGYSNDITTFIYFNMKTSTSGSGSVEETTYINYKWDDPDPNFNFEQAHVTDAGSRTNVIIDDNQFLSSDDLDFDNLDGQTTISESDGIYTISFSFTNSQNDVSGTFSGSLTDLNFEY